MGEKTSNEKFKIASFKYSYRIINMEGIMGSYLREDVGTDTHHLACLNEGWSEILEVHASLAAEFGNVLFLNFSFQYKEDGETCQKGDRLAHHYG